MQLPKINLNFLNKRRNQHILFWTFFFILEILDTMEHTGKIPLWLDLSLPILKLWDAAFIVYLNLIVFIPRFFNKKKYITNIFLVLVSSFLIAGVSYLFAHPFVDDLDLNRDHPVPRDMIFWGSFIQNVMLTLLTTLIHYTKEGVKLKDVSLKLSEVEKEKLDAELKSLKAQINPHFLFNMLNNIYSLTLQKSEKSPKMILMLSDLMSYILYDCQEEKVLLGKEIEFLKNLVALEQISVGDDISIKFEVDDSLNDYSVSPLMFIPFIENAFKHCSKNGVENSYVNISLKHKGEDVCLDIENSTDQNDEMIKDNYHGVGIQNVKKRLALLYPNSYQLDIEDKGDSYKASLCLKLQS